jgi:ribosomal-protein-alanine N-acetyltransferase
MVFLLGSVAPDGYAVENASVGLRPFHLADHAAWAELRAASRAHLVPYEPAWSESELERSAFRLRLRHHQREAAEDVGYAFGVFRLADDGLIGGISLSNVRRGVTQAAEVGYWLGHAHTGRGHMTEAVAALVAHAFGPLRLHRLTAATLPHNRASMRVLERNGFQREGAARSYLKINGVWSDHVLFGLVEDDVRVPRGGPTASDGRCGGDAAGRAGAP